MQLSPMHQKGILSTLFGRGRKEEPPASEAPPADQVSLSAPSATPAPAAPPAAPASPAPALPAGAAVGPDGKVALTPDLVAALTRTDVAGPLGELWSRPIADVTGPGYPKTLGTPVLSRDGSTAFFASERGLYAMSAQTGATGWTFDAGGKGIASRPFVGPDGTLYVSGGDGKVHALDPSTGKSVWSADSACGWISLGADGSLIVQGRETCSLDPRSGDLRWRSPVTGAIAAGTDGRIFRAGDGEKGCVAYDRDTGAELWRFSRGGLIRSRPTVGPDATVYVGDTNGGFYALDPATGQPKWEAKARGFVLYPSALSEDGSTVYVGSSDHHVYALDAATGREKWKRDVGAEVRMTPTVSPDGTIVLASDRNQIFVLDALTGAPMAQAPAASYVHVAPDAAGGRVVLQANNHTLYGFSAPLTSAMVARRAVETGAPAARGDIAVGEAAVRIGGVEIPIRQD